MTTIVYEGKTRTIFTDSMVTSKVAGACARTDMTYKVEDLSRLKILSGRGHRVVAMAFSGRLGVLERITKFVLSNLHSWKEGHKRLCDQGASLADFSGCNVILFTSKAMFCFRFDCPGDSWLEVKKVALNENVTFGSGGAFAKTAMEVYGACGFDAIAAASIGDPGTGCLIHSYRIEKNKLVPQQPVFYQDSVEERRRLRVRAGKSHENLEVNNPFTKAPENILINLHENTDVIKKVRKTEDTVRARLSELRQEARVKEKATKVTPKTSKKT